MAAFELVAATAQLLDTVRGLDRGVKATDEDKELVDNLAKQLEVSLLHMPPPHHGDGRLLNQASSANAGYESHEESSAV